MSLAERRWLRLFTLCALYVAQGIPWGFMATTLPAYLTRARRSTRHRRGGAVVHDAAVLVQVGVGADHRLVHDPGVRPPAPVDPVRAGDDGADRDRDGHASTHHARSSCSRG